MLVGRNILKAPVTGKERMSGMKRPVAGVVPIEVMTGTLTDECR